MIPGTVSTLRTCGDWGLFTKASADKSVAENRHPLLKAIAAYAVITLIFAWPLIAAFGSRVPVDDGDPLFNTWVLAWNSHALTTNPAGIFAANIFYPYENSLAYSDLMLPPALLVAPVNLLAGNPVIAYNLLVILSFIFSAFAMFLLVKLLVDSDAVAFLAGGAYAFSTYRIAQMGHIQLLTDGLLIMTVYFAHRWLVARKWRDISACVCFLVLQSLSGWYYGFYGVFFLASFMLFFAAARIIPLNRRILAQWLWVGAAAGLALLPFALPYLKLRASMPGFGRNLGETVYFSAGISDYFSTGQSGEHFLFPGVFTLAGVVIAAALSRFKGAFDERTDRSLIKRFYLLIALAAFILSLGPFIKVGAVRVTMPYLIAWQWLPGFKAMRVPARFGLLVTLSLVVLAAYGWQELATLYRERLKLSTAAKPVLLALAAIVIIAIQVGRPLKLSPEVPAAGNIPPVYRWLAKQKDKKVIELPSVRVKDDAAVGGSNVDVRYLYYSTYHWNQLVNGYSGYAPPEYAQIIGALSGFPDDLGTAVLRRLDVDYLIYHTGGDRRQIAILTKRAAGVAGISSAGQFGDDIVFKVRKTRGQPPGVSVRAALKAPAIVPVGTPVNIAWRVLNTTGERLIVRPKEQPSALFVWENGGSGRAWPRLPLIMEPGRGAWMRAQIEGPVKAGKQHLKLRLSSPLIEKANYEVEVEGVRALAVSGDNVGLGGSFRGAYSARKAVAGAKLNIAVDLVNTGKALWKAKFDPDASLEAPYDKGEVHLAAFWRDRRGKQLGDPQVLSLAYDVGPGQRYAERFLIDVPRRPGMYTLKLDLVALGVVWFKDLGINNPSVKVKVYGF